MTGYPWATGDALLAADLNAAFANGATAGGPFLPLSGGTITGPVNIQYAGTANSWTSAPTHPSAAFVNQSSQMHSYWLAAASGGVTADVSTNVMFQTSITGAPSQYIFNEVTVADYSGGPCNTQIVPIYTQGIRRVQHAGGTANNPEIWGAVIQVIDMTNTDSALTNNLTGLELDLNVGNGDSGKNRVGIGMYLNKNNNATDNTPTVDRAYTIFSGSGYSFNVLFDCHTLFNVAGLDFRTATQGSGAHAIWMGDSKSIAWDTAATAVTYWDAAAFSGSGAVHSSVRFENDGDVLFSGALTVGGLAWFAGSVPNSPGITGMMAAPPAIGGTTPAAGHFTTLTNNGTATFTDPTANSGGAADFTFAAPSNAWGVNIKMQGNGTTPSKTIRLTAGSLYILNDAGSLNLLTMDDNGNVTLQGGIFKFNTGLVSAANDAAAASAGIAVGGLYRNGSVVQIRVT